MHERKHLSLIGPCILFDSIRTERLRSAAAALIQRRDETGFCPHLLKLQCVHSRSPQIFRVEAFQPKGSGPNSAKGRTRSYLDWDHRPEFPRVERAVIVEGQDV